MSLGGLELRHAKLQPANCGAVGLLLSRLDHSPPSPRPIELRWRCRSSQATSNGPRAPRKCRGPRLCSQVGSGSDSRSGSALSPRQMEGPRAYVCISVPERQRRGGELDELLFRLATENYHNKVKMRRREQIRSVVPGSRWSWARGAWYSTLCTWNVSQRLNQRCAAPRWDWTPISHLRVDGRKRSTPSLEI